MSIYTIIHYFNILSNDTILLVPTINDPIRTIIIICKTVTSINLIMTHLPPQTPPDPRIYPPSPPHPRATGSLNKRRFASLKETMGLLPPPPPTTDLVS